MKQPLTPFICALNGSSRRKGQTADRLQSIVDDLKRFKADAKLIHLVDHPLGPSDGVEDNPTRHPDMEPLLRDIERADGIIFGTPTYWFNMSGLMKNLFDRLIVTEEPRWTLEGSVAGFIAVGSKDEDGAMIALSSMAATANHFGMVTFPYSMVYFRGSSGPSWAKDSLKHYAKSMLDMIELMRARGDKPWH